MSHLLLAGPPQHQRSPSKLTSNGGGDGAEPLRRPSLVRPCRSGVDERVIASLEPIDDLLRGGGVRDLEREPNAAICHVQRREERKIFVDHVCGIPWIRCVGVEQTRERFAEMYARKADGA